MDAHRKDRVLHLFAAAIEVAEMAHETAASGQPSSMPAADLIRAAGALDRHAGQMQAIRPAHPGEAVGESTEPSPEKPS